VESSNRHSKRIVKKLSKLYRRPDLPPCNKALDDWLTFLAQPTNTLDDPAHGPGSNSSSSPAHQGEMGPETYAAAPCGPLFVLCGGKSYWKQRPFFKAAAEQGRLIQRSEAIMQQHRVIHQTWKLSPSYYTQSDLDRISSTVTAALQHLQRTPLPPPALPPTAAYHLRLQLKGSAGSDAAEAAVVGAALAGTPAGAQPAIKPEPEAAMQELLSAWGAQVGPAARHLLDEALACGFPLPDEQQRHYFLLADQPFDAGELLSLHELKCSSMVATRFTSSERTRGGTTRDSFVCVRLGVSYVEHQYSSEAFPGFAAALLQLRDAVPGLADGTWDPSAAAAAAAAEAEAAAASSAVTPAAGAAAAAAARKLLLVLRCLREWEGKRVQQPKVPALLQLLLLFGEPRSCRCQAAADVIEVIDLVQQEEEEEANREMVAGGCTGHCHGNMMSQGHWRQNTA
jgi:hypothetical protein